MDTTIANVWFNSVVGPKSEQFNNSVIELIICTTASLKTLQAGGTVTMLYLQMGAVPHANVYVCIDHARPLFSIIAECVCGFVFFYIKYHSLGETILTNGGKGGDIT